VTVEPAQLTAEFRAVDRVSVPDRPVQTLKRYVVEAGNPGLRDAG
jgi:alkaline phosphatase D